MYDTVLQMVDRLLQHTHMFSDYCTRTEVSKLASAPLHMLSLDFNGNIRYTTSSLRAHQFQSSTMQKQETHSETLQLRPHQVTVH